MMLLLKLALEVGGQLIFWVGGWSDKTKVILNSTQFKLKLELSLAKMSKGIQASQEDCSALKLNYSTICQDYSVWGTVMRCFW